jgi:hypothetical protein
VTDDVLFSAPPQAPAGLFPAVITAVDPVTVETGEGPKALVRWVVAIELDDGTVAEPDALSSRMFTPKSKARRWATAVGVPADQKDLRASDLLGRECMAMVIEKDGGNTGLGDILPVPKKGGKAA